MKCRCTRGAAIVHVGVWGGQRFRRRATAAMAKDDASKKDDLITHRLCPETSRWRGAVSIVALQAISGHLNPNDNRQQAAAAAAQSLSIIAKTRNKRSNK